MAIDKAVLFGSYAKGTADENSDVDARLPFWTFCDFRAVTGGFRMKCFLNPPRPFGRICM
ncbi:MAG: nucleotidyltransferase domain-containing protein [Clostridium sp.]|jgi:hypothetical protein|nr:nucleotidyltransferase domain-containing protein [Clostridium sp.]